ncbi:glycine--tRNA ligase subunit beta, partial [Rhizobium sp. TRM95111]|uniref:glycine--tRNA ligase subunit beta n=1 Tax=Rhizobium alarense TaxID=2846851 RepID=UPI001F163587
VANIAAKDGGAEIVHGNGKVVRARLSDARHFWSRDQRDLPDLDTLAASAEKFGLDLSKPLDQRMAKLDALDVTFHAKLGTQGERVSRIRTLAADLAKVTGADPALVDRAVVLAKADLRTEAVGEFPELQGIMGRKYAVLQGEDPAVAEAIEDHYKPQGPSDRVPAGKVALTVALADKLDTLVGFWAIDEKPTGSKDPYALRRAALGVIRTMLDNEIGFDVISVCYAHARNCGYSAPMDLAFDLATFFADRLKVQLREDGIRPDYVDAVFDKGMLDQNQVPGMENVKNILSISRRAAALKQFLDSEDGRNLLAGTKRATQLLAAEEKKGTAVATSVSPDLLTLDAEKALHAATVTASAEAADAVAKEDFRSAMAALSKLRAPVDRFFDDVLVNDDDPAIRANRLALLAAIRAATGTVADFSKISG